MTPITITQDENNSDIELDIFLGKISIQDKHDQESITIALDKWQEVKETVDSMIDSLNEEPTDRFAMGTPSVAHAGENKKDDSDGGRSEPLHDFLDMFGLSDKSVDDIADGILGANNKDNNK